MCRLSGQQSLQSWVEDQKGPLMLKQRKEEAGACVGQGREEGWNDRAQSGIERVLGFIIKTRGRR